MALVKSVWSKHSPLRESVVVIQPVACIYPKLIAKKLRSVDWPVLDASTIELAPAISSGSQTTEKAWWLK
jgi:hypothetical protein